MVAAIAIKVYWRIQPCNNYCNHFIAVAIKCLGVTAAAVTVNFVPPPPTVWALLSLLLNHP